MSAVQHLPPSWPSTRIYTGCYCEENIYLLAQEFLKDPGLTALWDLQVVFISNTNHSVVLWNQKAASLGREYVIWDYHVILLCCSRSQRGNTWVYDFDSKLCETGPCSLEDYLTGTFPIPENDLPAQLVSSFRVVPAEDYLVHFASDRSHMLRRSDDNSDEPTYIMLPPTYPVLQGVQAAAQGVTNNLFSSFITMQVDESPYGEVVSLAGLRKLCEG